MPNRLLIKLLIIIDFIKVYISNQCDFQTQHHIDLVAVNYSAVEYSYIPNGPKYHSGVLDNRGPPGKSMLLKFENHNNFHRVIP